MREGGPIVKQGFVMSYGLCLCRSPLHRLCHGRFAGLDGVLARHVARQIWVFNVRAFRLILNKFGD